MDALVLLQVGQRDMDAGGLYREDSISKSLAVVSSDTREPRWTATVRTRVEWNRGDMDPDESGAMTDTETGSCGRRRRLLSRSVDIAPAISEHPERVR